MRNKSIHYPARPVSSLGFCAGKTCISALFIALTLIPLTAAAQERDLLELYQLAKAKDPALARSGARLESGVADKEIARAALLPRISANGSLKQFWPRVNNYSDRPIDGEFTGYSYGIGGTLYLLNMPSYYQVSAANAGIESADYAVQATHQDLIIRLVDAYMRYLKSAADEKLFRDELGRMGKVLDQVQAFLKEGTGDVIAVYEAKARMDSAAADLVKAEGQRKMAQQQLSNLTGVTVDAVKDITVSKAMGPEPAEIEWWVDTMRQRNPSLLQARKDLLQAEENSKAARTAHYPTIQGNGGYTVDKGSAFLPNVETEQWYAGIGLTIPIYSGGETSARARRALAGQKERRAMLDDAQDQGIKRLKEAYLNLQYNKSIVEAYRRKHESAGLQLKAVQKGRTLDTRTAIDLLNAEQAYSVSSRDLSGALYDNLQRRLELKAAAGILVGSDLTELDGEPMGDSK